MCLKAFADFSPYLNIIVVQHNQTYNFSSLLGGKRGSGGLRPPQAPVFLPPTSPGFSNVQ
jgi:hypothetical protein